MKHFCFQKFLNTNFIRRYVSCFVDIYDEFKLELSNYQWHKFWGIKLNKNCYLRNLNYDRNTKWI